MADKFRDSDVMAYWEYAKALREALEEFQWGNDPAEGRCLACHEVEPDHADDCELDALLTIRIESVFEVERSRFQIVPDAPKCCGGCGES